MAAKEAGNVQGHEVDEKKEEKRFVDLSELIFTKNNEEKGVPYEPEIFGVKIGLVFTVLGANSTRLIESIELFNKKLAEAHEIDNSVKRQQKLGELYIETAMDRVVSVKVADDADVVIENGRKFSGSRDDIRYIFENSPIIAANIVMFSNHSVNFTKREMDLRRL